MFYMPGETGQVRRATTSVRTLRQAEMSSKFKSQREETVRWCTNAANDHSAVLVKSREQGDLQTNLP